MMALLSKRVLQLGLISSSSSSSSSSILSGFCRQLSNKPNGNQAVLDNLALIISNYQARERLSSEQADTLRAAITDIRKPLKQKILSNYQARERLSSKQAETLTAAITDIRKPLKHEILSNYQARERLSSKQAETLTAAITDIRKPLKHEILSNYQARERLSSKQAETLTAAITDIRKPLKHEILSNYQARERLSSKQAETLTAAITDIRKPLKHEEHQLSSVQCETEKLNKIASSLEMLKANIEKTRIELRNEIAKESHATRTHVNDAFEDCWANFYTGCVAISGVLLVVGSSVFSMW